MWCDCACKLGDRSTKILRHFKSQLILFFFRNSQLYLEICMGLAGRYLVQFQMSTQLLKDPKVQVRRHLYLCIKKKKKLLHGSSRQFRSRARKTRVEFQLIDGSQPHLGVRMSV